MPPQAEEQPFTIDVQNCDRSVQVRRRHRGRSVLETTMIFRAADDSATRIRTENASGLRISITGQVPRPGDDEGEGFFARSTFEATACARSAFNVRTAVTVTHRDVNTAIARRRAGYSTVNYVLVAPIPESEVTEPPPFPGEIEAAAPVVESLSRDPDDNSFASEGTTRVEQPSDDADDADVREDVRDILASLPPRPKCPSPTTPNFDSFFDPLELSSAEALARLDSERTLCASSPLLSNSTLPIDTRAQASSSGLHEYMPRFADSLEYVDVPSGGPSVTDAHSEEPLPAMTFSSPSVDSLGNNTVEGRASSAGSARSNRSANRFINLSKNVRLILNRPAGSKGSTVTLQRGFSPAAASMASLSAASATQKTAARSMKLLLSSYATKAKGLSKGLKRSREDDENVDVSEFKSKEDRPIKGRLTRRKLVQ